MTVMGEERREGMGEVIDRLARIEVRLGRIEGGLILAGFLVTIAVGVFTAIHH